MFISRRLYEELSQRKEQKVDDSWPSTGEITIESLQMRCRDGLSLVLHGLSLGIAAREKVGVCGKMGSGTSFLFTALLFRIVEPVLHGPCYVTPRSWPSTKRAEVSLLVKTL